MCARCRHGGGSTPPPRLTTKIFSSFGFGSTLCARVAPLWLTTKLFSSFGFGSALCARVADMEEAADGGPADEEVEEDREDEDVEQGDGGAHPVVVARAAAPTRAADERAGSDTPSRRKASKSVKGKIRLMEASLIKGAKSLPDWIEQASDEGAQALIIVNDKKLCFLTRQYKEYESDIPVLIVNKSDDVSRLREHMSAKIKSGTSTT